MFDACITPRCATCSRRISVKNLSGQCFLCQPNNRQARVRRYCACGVKIRTDSTTGLCRKCYRETARRRNENQPLCIHCGKHPFREKRGLCYACRLVPEIRDLYRKKTKYSPTLEWQDVGKVPPCDTPTDAIPGTEAKIQAMAERARLRVGIFHPLDARG
jgi:hypothetical protein